MRLFRSLAPLAFAVCVLGAGYDEAPTEEQQQDSTGMMHESTGMADEHEVVMDDMDAPMSAEEILSKMHAANRMEIRLGELARDKATSARVRRYGVLLVRDHRLGDRKVQDAARRQDITLAQPSPEPEEQAMIERLLQVTGKEFDREFLEAMEQRHGKMIGMLRQAREQVDNPAVAELIGRLLPILGQHESLSTELKG